MNIKIATWNGVDEVDEVYYTPEEMKLMPSIENGARGEKNLLRMIFYGERPKRKRKRKVIK